MSNQHGHKRVVTGLAVLIFLLGVAATVRAADTNQFHLASQFDWGAAKGFFFVVESAPHGDHPASVTDAKLSIGIGDGHTWHFISGGDGFVPGHSYNVAVVIENGHSRIKLNDQTVAEMNCGFAPAAGEMLFNQPSNVMHAAAAYQVSEGVLHVQTNGITRDLQSTENGISPQLLMLNPAVASKGPEIQTGDSITLRTTIQFGPAASLRQLSPFIDQYGQCVQANWPEKVHTDADLQTARQLEAQQFAQWGMPTKFDQYGGSTDAGWKENQTGFFHVTKHDGKWWLITPEGNPCFYIGLCNAPAYVWEDTPVTGREYLFSWLPPHDGPFADAWVHDAWHIGDGLDYLCFHTANLIRKFGSDWKNQTTASAVQRVHALGFSGFGKWSDGNLGVCDLPVIGNHGPNLIKHPDVFDPHVRQQIEQLLRAQIEPRKNDPWLLGWSVGNEKDEDITADEVREILHAHADSPAGHAYKKFISEGNIHGPMEADSVIEQFREYYEQTYWSFLYKTVKAIDPNHLYFGNWVTPNWWENENDWKIAVANCDVLGFDWYADHFHAEPAGKLIASSDKPILCGEFSFPPTYDGQRGFGNYGTHVSTDAQAGAKYAQWLHDAASDPHCVGVFYFQYRDEPLTGRGPGNSRDVLVIGEDFAFGLVDETDRIKWDFAKAVRQANLSATHIRMNGAAR